MQILFVLLQQNKISEFTYNLSQKMSDTSTYLYYRNTFGFIWYNIFPHYFLYLQSLWLIGFTVDFNVCLGFKEIWS